MDIGSRIAAWRKFRGMSQRDLAKAVGVTHGAVAQWEGGGDVDVSPSLDNLDKIVAALRLSMTQFYGRVPKAKAAS
jgi:transcriptional regulator with XRE-family HTH domain